MKTRLIGVGGFLGSGKTTLLWEAAQRLATRDFHPTHRLRSMALLPQLHQKPIDIAVQRGGKVMDGLTVYTGSSFRRLHLRFCTLTLP